MPGLMSVSGSKIGWGAACGVARMERERSKRETKLHCETRLEATRRYAGYRFFIAQTQPQAMITFSFCPALPRLLRLLRPLDFPHSNTPSRRGGRRSSSRHPLRFGIARISPSREPSSGGWPLCCPLGTRRGS
jgi:hypothetical protein